METRLRAVGRHLSSSNVPEIKQGQSTAESAQFDLLSMGEGRGRGEGGV